MIILTEIIWKRYQMYLYYLKNFGIKNASERYNDLKLVNDNKEENKVEVTTNAEKTIEKAK